MYKIRGKLKHIIKHKLFLFSFQNTKIKNKIIKSIKNGENLNIKQNDYEIKQNIYDIVFFKEYTNNMYTHMILYSEHFSIKCKWKKTGNPNKPMTQKLFSMTKLLSNTFCQTFSRMSYFKVSKEQFFPFILICYIGERVPIHYIILL